MYVLRYNANFPYGIKGDEMKLTTGIGLLCMFSGVIIQILLTTLAYITEGTLGIIICALILSNSATILLYICVMGMIGHMINETIGDT